MPLAVAKLSKQWGLIPLLLLVGVGKWVGAHALGTLHGGGNKLSLLRPVERTQRSILNEGNRLRTNPTLSCIALSLTTPTIFSQTTTNSTADQSTEEASPQHTHSSTLSSIAIAPPAATTPTSTELYSVDVRYNRRSPLTYDATIGRYLDAAATETTMPSSSLSLTSTSSTTTNNHEYDTLFQKWGQFLHSAFVPEGVSESYFSYVRWRILQRFVNANVHVIGTQSLLMGLRGMQRSRFVDGGGGSAVLGAAAATNWVLKDTLGKVVRMAWASKMGRKFDPDAKRWRFRASLIYALGNGLEVSTYLHPQYFLVLAMLANSCKQMSMLTSSATRNALYNSFRRVDVVSSPSNVVTAGSGGNSTNSSTGNRRGSGGVENIGDITAKGEAQIAVVDLLGIVSGICLSRAVGVSVQNVFAVWVVLQIMEIFCMYHEMRSVVYKTFNFERMHTVLGKLLMNGIEVDVAEKYKFTGHNIPTPEQISTTEKIFLPPDHLARRAIAFGSPGRTLLDPDELDLLINDVFRGEMFFLVVGQDIKNQRGLSARVRQWMGKRRLRGDNWIDPQEQCHIVLHADANNLDILKSALALVILRKKLVKKVKCGNDSVKPVDIDPSSVLRSRNCMDELREACTEAGEIFPHFLRELTKQGWRPPLRSMLGRVSARAEWPIRRR